MEKSSGRYFWKVPTWLAAALLFSAVCMRRLARRPFRRRSRSHLVLARPIEHPGNRPLEPDVQQQEAHEELSEEIGDRPGDHELGGRVRAAVQELDHPVSAAEAQALR